MATTFTYPTASTLKSIEQVFVGQQTLDDPLFGSSGVFPIEKSDTEDVIWEQRENVTGTMQLRGMNGLPPRVDRVGRNQFRAPSGVYGEHETIDEQLMTRLRAMGQWGAPMDVTAQVVEIMEQLTVRQIALQRLICWQLLCLGSFQQRTVNGALVHSDSYNQRVYASAVSWANPTTSTPLQDFRSVLLMQRGYGTTFGPRATAYMNQGTANLMLGNSNPVDLYGRRTLGLGTFNNMADVSRLWTGDGLPSLQIFDDTFQAAGNVPQLYIPTGIVVVVGRRLSGTQIGSFRETRNANNPGGSPGTYAKIMDKTEDQVPPEIEVHRGFNGGPALYFPSSIVAMQVA